MVLSPIPNHTEMDAFIRTYFPFKRRMRMILDGKLSRLAPVPRTLEKVWDGAATGPNERLCIFAHYDRDGIVEDYVLYFLGQLRQMDCQVVFVSSSGLDDTQVSRLRPFCGKIVQRKNLGLDFGSWREGLLLVEDVRAFRQLILCNDSVYGPFRDLAPIFSRMEQGDAHLWSITDTFEMTYHLQSYFLVFESMLLHSRDFADFWEKFVMYRNKDNIINKYEVGVSAHFHDLGYRLAAAFPYSELLRNLESNPDSGRLLDAQAVNLLKSRKVNPSLVLWRVLLEGVGAPFVKRELLVSNPHGLPSVSDWRKLLAAYPGFNVEWAGKHISRISGK